MKFTASQAIGGLLCLGGIASASPVRSDGCTNAVSKNILPHRIFNEGSRTQHIMRERRYRNIRKNFDSNWMKSPCPSQNQGGQGGNSPDSVQAPSPTETDAPEDTDAPGPSGTGEPTATASAGPTATPNYFEVPLDHTDKSKGTFKNRYFVNDMYYQEGGPIIVYDGGESGLTGQDLFAPDDLNTKHAKEHNGMVIQWEHRYYGESVPKCDFNISESAAGGASEPTVDADTVGEFYKYLTLNQSLDDLALFAKSFKWNINGSDYETSLSAEKVPWVMIGGSYPGQRVGYMQARYPNLFSFGLASSACVGFKVDYWEYYVPAERKLVAAGLDGCAADIHTTADYLSKAYKANNIKALKAFSDVYNKQAGDDDTYNLIKNNGTKDDFASYIGGWYTNPMSNIQYDGVYSKNGDSPNIGTLDFCHYFQAGANKSTTAVADKKKGFSATLKPAQVAQLYVKALADVYTKLPASQDASISSTTWKYDGSSWDFQTCTELMSFQTGNSTRETNLIPDFFSVTSSLKGCKDHFGASALSFDQITELRDELEAQYGGWYLEADNIFWTNGEYDPWRFLGQTTDIKEDGGPFFPNQTTDIPDCGKELPKGTQLSYILKEATHCDDLGPINDPDEPTVEPNTAIEMHFKPAVKDVLTAQKVWDDVLDSWLKKGCAPKANVDLVKEV